MFNFPPQTFFNHRVAKDKLATQLHFTSSIRRILNEQIKSVHWAYVLAERTLNINKGKRVEEIEVFHLLLNQQSLDERVLQQWDRELPHHILFVLEYNGQVQAHISFKLPDGSNKAYYSIKRCFCTPWMPLGQLSFTITGLTLDNVYENLVQQIAGEELPPDDDAELAERVEKSNLRQEIQEKIDKLQAKIRKEKQFNRQMELKSKAYELEQILKGISEGL